MDKNELKKLLCEAVDSVKDQTKAFADDVAAHAELGFFETRTSDKLAGALEGLGLDVKRGLARTGLRADIEGGAQGPKVAVIGELDGIVCRKHPLAVEETGASHACGHNLQISAVYAMAAALVKTGLMKELHYGEGYQYAHNTEEKLTHMQCMPEGMEDVIYYRPTDQGKEKEAGERLEAIRRFQGKE